MLVVLSQGWSIEIQALGCNPDQEKELWNRMEDKGQRIQRKKRRRREETALPQSD